MGLTKTTLMLGIYAAATNLRLARRWQPDPDETSDQSAGPEPTEDALASPPGTDELRPTG